MKYVGIDLGTTNSAICSYDGENLRLYKSPEQHDVTPSAILIDKRGNKYVGSRAYNGAARNPDNAATLFKRLMGTSTPITLSAAGLTMTPEACSAEILRTLFGYLPEEIRTDADIGTVITVPAAFNQMQKDATMAAAEAAGLGRVALMQEPVAAVMAVMRQRRGDGIFLVYDIGGGTLDIAIAQSGSGRVNLLAHGGIAMCGGRDFDRILYDNVVRPWLMSHFDLPEDMATNPTFKPLMRLGTWAAEKAKIELSQKEEAVIALQESEVGIRDLSGEEIYLDIPLSRETFDALISDRIDQSIAATRETLEKAHLSPQDVERIVFVGGPAHYKPLRDKVSFQMGIAASTEVNVMTAVAEGAAVFAESIDWASQSRGRKSTRGALATGGPLDLSFAYTARTPDTRAKIVAKSGTSLPEGCEFQVDSLDTGWSSGRTVLGEGAGVDLPLAKAGENRFKVFVFDRTGGPVALKSDQIVIARTAASIDAIPASHSIAIEAKERMGGPTVLAYLVREGDPLPKRGRKVFKAEETMKAGSPGALRFNLWEGEFKDRPEDNRFIGLFEVKGSDFEDGVIAQGAELICDYEMLDSGVLRLEVSVPSIGGSFPSHQNFYSAQAGKVDYTNHGRVIRDQSKAALERVDEIAAVVEDERLDEARNALRAASRIDLRAEPERAREADEQVQEAKKQIAKVRQDNRKVIRQIDLDRATSFFDNNLRDTAKPSDRSSFDNLARTAQRSIDENAADFESLLSELNGRIAALLFRTDGFVVQIFQNQAENPQDFADPQAYARLMGEGAAALQTGDIDRLRRVVLGLVQIRIGGGDDGMAGMSNILLGT